MNYKYQVGDTLQVTSKKRGVVVKCTVSVSKEPLYIVEDSDGCQTAVLERKVYWKVRV